MNNKENNNIDDNVIRNICDKKTLETIKMLEIVNKEKANLIKNKIITLFSQNNQVITFDDYLKIINKDNIEPKVKIERKNNNLFNLTNIDDIY